MVRWRRAAGAALGFLSACLVYGEDLLLPVEDGTGGVGGSAAGGDDVGGAGGDPSMGGTGGAGGVTDLGWPLDDSLPTRCPSDPPAGGSAWTGWGNFQFPASVSVALNGTTELLFGRTYRAGETDGVGQATGWEAELGVGPLGTLPTGEGRCWSYVAASFNVDAGNDDEYASTLTPDTAGLFSLFFRYRPPGGAWRYGDLDGSDDGISVDDAAALVVSDPSTAAAPLIVATLNLRCRLDDWPARRPLVVQSLARVDPDLVAFQEDCVDGAGFSQAEEVRAELATYTRRGYAFRRAGTHQATSGDDVYDEGISVLSAHPIGATHTLDLAYVQIPRKALAVDVVIRGQPLRFYSTHFDFGADAAAARRQSAEAIVADLPSAGIAIVGGDLNAQSGEPAYQTLSDALIDLWSRANPNTAGDTFPAAAPTGRIDYLFGSGSLGAALTGAKLLDEENAGVFSSDHLGVATAVSYP